MRTEGHPLVASISVGGQPEGARMLADESRHIPRQITADRSRKSIWVACVSALSVALLVLTSATPAKAIPPPPPCAAARRLCMAVYRYPDSGRGWQMVIAGPAGRYFHRYRLCVQAPNGTIECHAFRIPAPTFGHFDSRITWRRHFTSQGPGHYIVRWHALPTGLILGRPSSFRVSSPRTGFVRKTIGAWARA
jgi:hypothetical protein